MPHSRRAERWQIACIFEVRGPRDKAMVLNRDELERLARAREGFITADTALEDALAGYARGTVSAEQVRFDLERHRENYERYSRGLYALLVPVAQA